MFLSGGVFSGEVSSEGVSAGDVSREGVVSGWFCVEKEMLTLFPKIGVFLKKHVGRKIAITHNF